MRRYQQCGKSSNLGNIKHKRLIHEQARPWAVAEKWTHLLQKEFANQGEMEQAVGMETTLFGGPPELGNMLKLANGQIGFMTIFAHPLFANVADIIPAMSFAAEEILTNKGVWFTRAEKEKMRQVIKKGTGVGDGGSVSPRSLSPVGHGRKSYTESKDSYFPSSPLAQTAETSSARESRMGQTKSGNSTPQNDSRRSSLDAVAGIATPDREADSRRSSTDSKRGRKNPRKLKDLPQSATNIANGVHTPRDTLQPGGVNRSTGLSGSSENEDPNRRPSPQSDTALQSPGGTDGAHDDRRDNAVSMRAGSTAIPISEEEQNRIKAERPAAALEAFNFATSDKDEPVRTYDPEKHYSPVHQSARASVPAQNLEKMHEKGENSEKVAKLWPSQTVDNADNTHSPAINQGAAFTPSQGTDTADYLSDEQEMGTPRLGAQKSDFEMKRSRAASAPGQVTSPNLAPSFSVSSNQSGSRDSSKYDVHATILSNGDVASEEGSNRDYRKGSTRTLGRKRSRIKLGLSSLWRKKGSSRDMGEESETQSTEGALSAS